MQTEIKNTFLVCKLTMLSENVNKIKMNIFVENSIFKIVFTITIVYVIDKLKGKQVNNKYKQHYLQHVSLFPFMSCFW